MIISHTPITKPCNAEEGINVIYFTIPKTRIRTMSSPLMMVSKGTRSAPNSRTNRRIIHDNAHAIPNTLCLLDVVRAANQHPQIPVSNQVNGSKPLASANEILKGMLMVATESHAFTFSTRLVGNETRYIVLEKPKKTPLWCAKDLLRKRLLL